MADQKRWFKLWCSAPGDDDLQLLPPDLRWAWAAFGCYTKLHGTNGMVTVRPSNHVLAAHLGIAPPDLLKTIASLPKIAIGTAPIRWPHGHDKEPVCAGEFVWGSYPPNVRGSDLLEEWCKRNGKVVVTWKNWQKYQEDTTVAERGRALRSKRRGEEKRRDEKRQEEKEEASSPRLHAEEPPFWPSWPSPNALVALYNTETPDECPAVTKLSPARRKKAQQYLAAFPDREWWVAMFRRINGSPFLRGLKPSPGHENFRADFDWLLSKGKDQTENAVKVAEGKYDHG